ncbi:hypothetical protein K2Y00_04100 [Patescibacteria group bacterium]|nr:hypothetical protein [Patescibacteria group bacterium]
MTGEGDPTGSSGPSTVFSILERMDSRSRKDFFLNLSLASQEEFRTRLASEQGWDRTRIDAYFGIVSDAPTPPSPDPKPERRLGRPKVESRGPWGQDRLGWYKIHHPDLTRSQLKEENRPLYEDLTSHGELDSIPVKRAFNDNPLAFYRLHYAGETRGELQASNPTLYQALLRRDQLGEIPLKRPYGDDPFAHYDKHYSGVTRGQLAKRDPAFYNYLYRRNLHTEIPLQEVRPKRGSYKQTQTDIEPSPELPREPRGAPFKAFTGETTAAIEYWDTSMSNPRMVLQPVSARKYLELYRGGQLRFQIENTEPPESYPTLEEVEEKVSKRG